MPNIWAHMMFGRECLSEAGFELTSDYSNFFNLGTQGPDPLFYYNFWPWLDSSPGERIGGLIHQKHCGPFLLELIKHGKSYVDHPELADYILGFVTHHLLDVHCHPYIFYRSGSSKNKHQILETAIDVRLMEEKYNYHVWRTPVVHHLSVGQALPVSIQNSLRGTIMTFFPEADAAVNTAYVQKSYKDMMNAHRVLYDPSGMKLKVLGSLIAPFSFHQLPADTPDILNERRAPWRHPSDPDEIHHESFMDMWQSALDEAVPIIKAILAYWQTEEGSEEKLDGISERLGSRSYETGKPCEEDWPIRYEEPIV